MPNPRLDMLPLPGLLQDSLDARPVPVVVSRYDKRVVVRGDNDVIALPVNRLRRDSAVAGKPVLYRSDKRGWRVALTDVSPNSWVGEIRPKMGLATRLILVGASSAAIITAGLWLARDGIIVATAPLLPHSVTDPIGRAYLAEMGKSCSGGPGNAALTRLAARLLPRALPEPVTVTVVDNPAVNAVALPGGHVALFRGLVDQAASADEIAAALAHEIEHIAFQHPNQSILRASGPAVIARTLGSDLGKMAKLTVLKKGNRAAEAEADGGAIALLTAANVSTQPAADFFARQAAARGDFSTSHPSDRERAKRFAAAARSGTAAALDDQDWQAFKAICQV
jgi:beta-barrel assembly-enhancing protease